MPFNGKLAWSILKINISFILLYYKWGKYNRCNLSSPHGRVKEDDFNPIDERKMR